MKITNEYLHYRLESALSPAMLHFVAQKRLGMVAPDLSKIVVLAPSPFGKDCGFPIFLDGRLPSAFGEGLPCSQGLTLTTYVILPL